MARKDLNAKVDRRQFLAGAIVAGAASPWAASSASAAFFGFPLGGGGGGT